MSLKYEPASEQQVNSSAFKILDVDNFSKKHSWLI